MILFTEDLGGEIAVSYVRFSCSVIDCPTCGRLTIGIRVLNFWLILPLLTASINGLDSSLVNGEEGW